MANAVKRAGQKVCSQDLQNSSVDVQYINNGDAQDISWASIVNAQPEKGESFSRKNCPTSSLLAVDCENVSKAHLPLAASKVVSEDCMVLEMTVSSEFTLVGYGDQRDDHIPDEEILRNYIGTFESGICQRPRRGRRSLASAQNGHKSEMPGLKPESKSRSGRPRGHPHRAQKNAVEEDENDFKPRSVVKSRKVAVEKESLHNCEKCDLSFSTSGGLRVHMTVHSENGNHHCFVCGKGFESLSGLKDHVTAHTSASNHFCDKCGRWFKDQVVLWKHIARHGERLDGGKISDCSMCGDEYDTEGDLAEHVLDHLPQLKANACLVCGRHLAPMSSMEKHLRTHTGEKMASCPICARKFAEAYNLKSHMRIHTGERPFSCPHCKRRFTSISTMKNHVLTHSSLKQYACSYCDKRFRRSSHLVEHRRSHTGEKPYSCVHCGKRYTTSTALRSHLITHSHEKQFTCSVCDFATARSLTLRKHMRTHTKKLDDVEPDGAEKEYMCADCGRQFARMKNMEKHLEMHRRLREQGVDDCVAVANVHSMEKSFECFGCDRKFARHRNLQKHRLTIHGETELAAELASTPFRRIGDKPYICAECGRLFARIGNMQKHFLTHWDQQVEDDRSVKSDN